MEPRIEQSQLLAKVEINLIRMIRRVEQILKRKRRIATRKVKKKKKRRRLENLPEPSLVIYSSQWSMYLKLKRKRAFHTKKQ